MNKAMLTIFSVFAVWQRDLAGSIRLDQGCLSGWSDELLTTATTAATAKRHRSLARKPKPPTLTSRMATAEEKLDVLAAQMKSMLLLMETFNRWRLEVDRFSTELNKDVKQLTSRVEALEAQPKSAPPSGPAARGRGAGQGPRLPLSIFTVVLNYGYKRTKHNTLMMTLVGQSFALLLSLKFGRDLYHNAMNDLQIKQTADVQEYYDRSQCAMHKVLVHNKSLDDVFFVSKFLQGLKPDISAAIVLHKPRTVDAALSLALMQANILDNQTKPFFNRASRNYNKYQGKQTVNTQPGILGPHNNEDPKPKGDDKLAALRSQRRAQGLCMKCGEKWSRQHKCPDKVSLHVLEEVLDAMHTESDSDDSQETSSDEDGDEVFQLSNWAAEGVQGKKTLKLTGLVGNQEILILIDSGSSCTFISDKAVKAL
ncbi:unnamed protein product [Miscanthus lutarioriparius]|uniref:Uncharacterized protein n=1 Tax=Miscanthus lutarioriparius TaxID=422564 RepID=A0A811NN81_9POAL|nr:unnamed protein product [Miscanthus lutarioriparius]